MAPLNRLQGVPASSGTRDCTHVRCRVQDLRSIPEFTQLGLHLSVVVWEAQIPTAYQDFNVFDTDILEGASLLRSMLDQSSDEALVSP